MPSLVTDFGTLKFHLDATQETYAHGANMAGGWSDRSGNGRHFTWEGSTEIVDDGRFGSDSWARRIKSADFLAGSDRFSRAEAALVPASSTVFVCWQPGLALPAVNEFLFDTAADSALSRHSLQWLATGAISLGLDGGGGSISTPAGVTVAGRRHIVTATFGASGTPTSRILFDDLAVVTGTLTGALASVSPMRIGARFDATGTGFLTPADVFEIGVFTGALTVANQDGLHALLMAKYRRDRWQTATSSLVMA